MAGVHCGALVGSQQHIDRSDGALTQMERIADWPDPRLALT
jgi:hypothetical protein